MMNEVNTHLNVFWIFFFLHYLKSSDQIKPGYSTTGHGLYYVNFIKQILTEKKTLQYKAHVIMQ